MWSIGTQSCEANFLRVACDTLLKLVRSDTILCKDLSNLSDYTRPIPNHVFKMMKRCLPGSYTFILDANSNVPKLFQRKKKTVGIRIPKNRIIQNIIEELGNPVLSTSLHHKDKVLDYISDAEMIYEEYRNKVDIVIDGGIGGNVPSTIVDCTSNELAIIRDGLGDISLIY